MDPSYDDEEKIVWLKDQETLARMAYVREKVQICSIRTCPVRAPQGEMLIGYAVLKRTAAKTEPGGFRRRIFTIHPEDCHCEAEPSGTIREQEPLPIPSEAVDPLSVQAGKPSRRLCLSEQASPETK